MTEAVRKSVIDQAQCDEMTSAAGVAVQERDAARAEVSKLQGQATAMRKALEQRRAYIEAGVCRDEVEELSDIDAALSYSAGRDEAAVIEKVATLRARVAELEAEILDRLRELEERVSRLENKHVTKHDGGAG
jgi:hypothetical protein